MNCPYCGKEMEKGFINDRNSVRWYPGEADWFGTMMADEYTVLLAKGGFVTSAKAESWYCPDCRMVITPVPEIEGSFDKVKKKWDAFAERVEQQSEKRQAEYEAQQHRKKREKQRKKDPWEV
jgi:hypothetical protein